MTICVVAAFVATGLYFLVGLIQGTQFAQRGYAAVKAKDADHAISWFNSALTKRLPAAEKAVIYLNRGSAWNSKRRFDDAIRDLNEAERLNPNLAYIYVQRAWAFQQQGARDKALADFTRAIAMDPNIAAAYYDRGQLFYERGDFARARDDLNEAVRCDPQNANGFLLRGLCCVGLKDSDAALANFDAAIMLDPNNAHALAERAKIYHDRGQLQKSTTDFARAERLFALDKPLPQATPVPSSSTLGFDTHLGASTGSGAAIPPVSAIDSATAYEQLLQSANAAWRAGDDDRAIMLCNRILLLPITPAQQSVVLMRRGTAHEDKDELDLALDDFNDAIRLDLKNDGAFVDRGLAEAHAFKYREAMNDFAEAIRLNPRDPLAFHNRATINLKTADLDAALNDFAKELELNPTDSDAHAGRASAFRRRNELAKALAECNLALERNPNSLIAWLERAKIYAQAKDYANARKDLDAIANLRLTRPGAQCIAVAWLHATHPDAAMRDGKAAVVEATKGCELDHWTHWWYIGTLAAAYAEAGDFEQAIRHQRKALEMTPLQNEFHRDVQQRLALYEAHQPYRDTQR